MRLQDKVCIITGAAQGIGEAIAREFVAQGASVVLTDVNGAGGEAVADELGDRARFVRADAANEQDWEAVLAAAEKIGVPDVLVNNAGVVDVAPLVDTPLESWQRVIDLNQTGVFLGMRTFGKPMCTAGRGSVINVSSMDGIRAWAPAISYVASKFAVRGMSKAAALEFGPFNVRVNSLHPGVIATPLVQSYWDGDGRAAHDMQLARVPLGRFGTPEDVAKSALFFASDDSAYITGTEHVIDGGTIAGVTNSIDEQ